MTQQSVLATTNRTALTILLGLYLIFLAACQSNFGPGFDYIQEKLDVFAIPTLPCPNARILDAGEHYVRYQKGLGRDITDIEMEAQITELTFTCGMAGRDREPVTPQNASWNVVVELDILIRAQSGPAIRGEPTQNIPFFVALVDRFGQIVEKQSFSAEIAFPKNTGPTSRTHKENILLTIPVRDVDEADSYETIVSFQLTKEQLNETHKQERGTNRN